MCLCRTASNSESTQVQGNTATDTHFNCYMYYFQPERHVPAQMQEVTLTPCWWMLSHKTHAVCFHLSLQISKLITTFASTFQVRNSYQAASLSNLLLMNSYLSQDS